MSERPFMQLYVSDFLGDTLDLSTEGIGAYMLLLMAMWNAGGNLPDDETKLARITRMSVKKWRAIATDLMEFFERDNGRITHQRLSKELQKSESKSESRASAGEMGGRAKALKDKNASLANATSLPQHLPDARSHIEVIKPPAQQLTTAARPSDPMLLDKLASALGLDLSHISPTSQLLKPWPITVLLGKGYSLETDVLPYIREITAAGKTFQNWTYVVPGIVERAAKRAAIPVKPSPPAEDWGKRLAVWRESRTWAPAWGPNPDEPGCKAPKELTRNAA